MSPQRSVTQSRLNNIAEYLTVAAAALQQFSDARRSACLNTISSIILSLATLAQTVKRNGAECIQLMEGVHTLVYALVRLLMKSNGGALPPRIFDTGKVTETLQKIHLFVEGQQDQRNIRNNGPTPVLDDCKVGLQEAFSAFEDPSCIQISSQRAHEELLQFVPALPHANASHKISITRGVFSSPRTGHAIAARSSFRDIPPSGSRPPTPHSSCGTELKHIFAAVAQESARTAYWVSSRFQANYETQS
ncbi:hypothetical protein C8R44DRAFT_790792 [Mycena epipterygia]|nr:hypothetical protein C8R44DRAFT_790792 [Mycena epipterygia]